jgi:UDP-N-acetyl-D-mannosaminuronic acid dehydrogenase
MKEFERICVIGQGYIGLPTSAILAQAGFKVLGVDINERIVNTINKGQVHISEPDLDGLVQKMVSSGKLTASTKPEQADAFIIAVPTPIRDDTRPDLTYVFDAARLIAPVLREGNLVILESTVPVGTTEKMADILADLRPDLTFPQQAGEAAQVNVAFSPERVLPGRILTELIHNDRSIGGLTKRCSFAAAEIYKRFVRGQIVLTDVRVAEMVKLSENAFRDVNLAFANELGMICEKLGIDVWRVISTANRHPRVKILSPGPGVGGHCIPVDPYFIIHSAPDQSILLKAARQVNEAKPNTVLDRVLKAIEGVPNPVVACLGLAFKADVDDLRNSPALAIAERIAKEKATVLAVEPNIEGLPKSLAAFDVKLTDTFTAIDRADVIVLLVDHRQFRYIDRNSLSKKKVIDTRGLWADRPATLQ